MRAKICDVCEEAFNADEAMIFMEVPAHFIKQEGENIGLDICSWSCIGQIIKAYMPVRGPGEDPIAPEPEEEKVERTVTFQPGEQVAVRPMDDKRALEEYTEAVTGVHRR